VFKGLVIILAVVFDQVNQKMNTRRALTEGKQAKQAA
jgi:ribose/xylose/arabinose/galactoside ABC-type transport system permease subunit